MVLQLEEANLKPFPFSYITFAALETVASDPTLISGSDIISPTLVVPMERH